ncbi:Carbamoylphosphate synthase large subunit [Pseudozyma hubeiensis]|nr:Carbamoylphosphate synthase large subunit [Pseudozyma hubeiensis]
MAQQLPNRLQSTLSTLLLLGLALALAPFSLIVSLLFSLTHAGSNKHVPNQHHSRSSGSLVNGHSHAHAAQRTVLVNGARMQKSLAICRTFARNGWKVVLVEEQGWGNLAATRFSNSVSSFHLLPSSSLPASKNSRHQVTPYIEALVRVALSEKVDLFFPCSGAGTTGQDAVAAQILLEKTHGRVRSMIQTPELVEALHEKDRFISLLQRLEMAAPRSEIVFSVDEALAKLRSEGYPRSILKCAAELDDIGRADMTLYPLLDAQTDEPDWDRTRQRLSNLSIPLCARTPYILQEFIGDRIDKSRQVRGDKTTIKSSEWCTHATVVDGKLTAFVCCPSNDMLMTYYPASHTIVGELALRWTSTFLYRLERLGLSSSSKSAIPLSPLTRDTQWNRDTLVGKHAPLDAGITGQFSMDFIYQPATSDQPERLVAIECNPRVHTAICLLVNDPRLGEALVPASMSRKGQSAVDAVRVDSMDEITYLSSLSLPVMESPPDAHLATQAELKALTSLPPTFASSRVRFYHAKKLLQQAYFSDSATLPQSWIGHDLPSRILTSSRWLSTPWVQTIMRSIHPFWTTSTAADSDVITIPNASGGVESFDLSASAPLPPLTDPSFAKDDPWPFFALYHLQWPQLLLWQLVVRGKKWSRINVSTARIFEC